MRLNIVWGLAVSLCGCGLVLDLDPSDQPEIDGGAPFDAGSGNACDGAEDGTPCPGGRCSAGTCVASVCGDRIVDPGEECDDGNDAAGDGCEPVTCVFSCEANTDCGVSTECASATCSEGRACVFELAVDGDPCGDLGGNGGTCQGGTCVPSSCGNAVLDTGEECDDGNFDRGDGCSPTCSAECIEDSECNDGIHCNGEERCLFITGGGAFCAPGAPPTAPLCFECSRETGDFELRDDDRDGYAAEALGECDGLGGDCNDMDASINPGASDPAAVDDAIDQDCDGIADDDERVMCAPDEDGDGWGTSAFTTGEACPMGTVRVRTGPDGTPIADCDDGNVLVFPGQTSWFAISRCSEGGVGEMCFDYDCDGMAERRWRAIFCSTATTGGSCAGEGFVGGVPECGQPGSFATCTFDPSRGCVVSSATSRVLQECH